MSYYAKRFFGQQGIVTDGLKLWLDASNPLSYPGTGTTWFDLSGNNNNGTMLNGVVPLSNAMQFDGVNDFVDTSKIASGIGSSTNMIWFKTTKTTRQGLIGTRSNAVNNGYILCINRTLQGNLTYFHTGNLGTVIEINAGILTNTWYMATQTYDNLSKQIKLYLNNVFLGEITSTEFNNSGLNPYIGRERTVDTFFFNGQLNDTLIYNRALTAEEVNQNFQATRNKYGI